MGARSAEQQLRLITTELRTWHPFRYYGITGNSIQIGRFRQEVQRAWREWLNRRSQRAKMTWARFRKLSKRYPLPPAIAYHSVCRA